MGKIFSLDSPFVQFMNRVADIMWLNILFVICCIPVITIGASVTAMYYVTLKMVRNEESYITKSFFKSFKLNFKQATAIWLIILAAGGLFYIWMVYWYASIPSSYAPQHPSGCHRHFGAALPRIRALSGQLWTLCSPPIHQITIMYSTIFYSILSTYPEFQNSEYKKAPQNQHFATFLL